MKSIRNKNLILNPVFIFGIIILFLNDRIWKVEFSNFITGKLSDVCGIIIFPLLLTYLFPKLKQNSIFLAAGLFVFWKSEYSQILIDLYNEISPIQTSRIIDYSDLFVLFLLPIPYFIIKNIEKLERISFKVLNQRLVFVFSLFALIATSPPPSFYYTMNEGNLQCYKCNIKVNYDKDYVIDKLKQNGIEFDSIQPIFFPGIDSTKVKYFKKELIIENDTLRNIDLTIFSLKNDRTQIYFNGMDVSENLQNDKKLERKLRRYYKKIIFNEIKSNL